MAIFQPVSPEFCALRHEGDEAAVRGVVLESAAPDDAAALFAAVRVRQDDVAAEARALRGREARDLRPGDRQAVLRERARARDVDGVVARLGNGLAVLALLGVAPKVTAPVRCDKSPTALVS